MYVMDEKNQISVHVGLPFFFFFFWHLNLQWVQWVTKQCLFVVGDVAVKILKVTDPTPEQFQAFRNEVAVLR